MTKYAHALASLAIRGHTYGIFAQCLQRPLYGLFPLAIITIPMQ